VAIFIRQRLLTTGVLKVGRHASGAPDDGRILTPPVEWCGHKMLWACVYMPNEAVQQKAFIVERLAPL